LALVPELGDSTTIGPDQEYQEGDRILVTGGYDMDPSWLQESPGYAGRLVAMTANAASVELDRELVLPAPAGVTWQDFGSGSKGPIREVETAQGGWLALMPGYVGFAWPVPGPRIHVGLCEEQPNLSGIPEGGGIGYWVESHAACRLLERPA
jgi:hypothetical protein